MWFIGVEVEQDTSAPPPKKKPGSAPCIGTAAPNKCFQIRQMILACLVNLELP